MPTSAKQSSGPAVALRAAQDRFISLWGQMGSSWGIPRSMAEVHALLYISREPMNADGIMERLAVSRGSASTSLHALIDWGLIFRVHKRGDRKEYFRAEQDVGRMCGIILRERKRREIDPLLAALHECREMTEEGGLRGEVVGVGGGDSEVAIGVHNRRLDDLVQFLRLVDSLAEQVASPAGDGLRVAADLLGKVV